MNVPEDATSSRGMSPHLVPYAIAPNGAPNIVVIVMDDVGFGQLGCFGSPLRTPNIDALARDGLRFNRFHVTSICSSTRAALLTGRNHHAVGVGATQETSFALPGYHGRLPKTAACLPRILRDNGYNAMAVGKWHLTPQAEYSASGPFDRWPLGLGFERFYGFLGAETNHWSPELVRDNTPVESPRRTSQSETYHLTDDLVDRAIAMITAQQQASSDKPFLLWFATGAMHAPHHVATQWIEPYTGRFDGGWERLRADTFARQVESGIIPAATTLTPRPTWVPEWDTLSQDERRLFARYMEVYAGFLTHTDAQIGRLLDALDTLDISDNTIVMVMSDNGASSEGGPTGTLNEAASWLGDFASVAEALDHIDSIGGPDHTNHYPWGWAWAGNSPFRLWKRYSWLGGVRAPLIVRWPARIADPGSIRSQFTHAIDIAPTLLGALGLQMPHHVDGIAQQRVDGVDAHRVFEQADHPEFHHTQYFEMHGSRSIFHNGWKATTNFVSPLFGERAHITGSQSFDDDVWELFDLESDFSEAHDVGNEYGDVLDDLRRRWDDEAQRNAVYPLFDPTAGHPAHPGEFPLPPSARYLPSDQPIAASRLPSLYGGFTLRANLEAGADDSGVLCAIGDHQGGFVLGLDSGRVYFDAVQGHARTHMLAGTAIDSGHHVVTVTMEGGVLTLLIDEVSVARGTFDGFFMFPGVTTAAGGLWIGRHNGLPVSNRYTSPAQFTGRLTDVTILSARQSSRTSSSLSHRIARGAD